MLPKLQVTKLDVARRQLEVAIRLYFHEGDPVSIHTLTAAAYNILRDLSKHRGSTGMVMKDMLIEKIKPEHRDEVRRKINEAENYFKHADKDADQLFIFSPRQSEFLLYDACFKYRELSGEFPPLIQLFLGWHMINNQAMYVLPPHLDAVRSEFARKAAHLTRTQFFTEYLPAIESLGLE
jgi:hypothetical protein